MCPIFSATESMKCTRQLWGSWRCEPKAIKYSSCMFLYVSLSKTSASALSAGPDDFLGASFQSRRFICGEEDTQETAISYHSTHSEFLILKQTRSILSNKWFLCVLWQNSQGSLSDGSRNCYRVEDHRATISPVICVASCIAYEWIFLFSFFYFFFFLSGLLPWLIIVSVLH